MKIPCSNGGLLDISGSPISIELNFRILQNAEDFSDSDIIELDKVIADSSGTKYGIMNVISAYDIWRHGMMRPGYIEESYVKSWPNSEGSELISIADNLTILSDMRAHLVFGV